MFGDYFQHDAHELLCCILTHIDDAVTALGQFYSSALSNHQLHSSTSHHTVSQSAAQCSPHDILVSMPPSPISSLSTRSVQSLSPSVAVESQPVGGSLQSPASSHRLSPVAGCSRRDTMVSTPSPASSLLARFTQSISQSKDIYMEPYVTTVSEAQSCRAVSPGLMTVDAQGSVGGRSYQSPTSCSPSSRSVKSCRELSPVTALGSVRAGPHQSVSCDTSVLPVTTPSPDNSRLTRSLRRSLSQGEKVEAQRSVVGGLRVDGKPYQPVIFHTYSAVTTTPTSSNSRLTRSVHRSLSQGLVCGGGQFQPINHHSHSLPSSPFTSVLLVDLCMPRRYSSLGRLSGRQRLLSTVTVSPDLLCDRLKRKRISSSRSSPTKCVPRRCSSLGHLSSRQQASSTVSASLDLSCERMKRKRRLRCSRRRIPTKYKDFVSSYFSKVVGDDLGKDCELAAYDCLHDSSVTDGSQTYKSSDELMICRTSGDDYPADCVDLTHDEAKLTCNTGTLPTSVPLPDGQKCSPISNSQDSHQEDCIDLRDDDARLTCNALPVGDALANGQQCSLEVIPPPASVKHQLMLSLQAIENGRSCNVSLCHEDVSEAASHRNCRLVVVAVVA